MGTTSLFFYNPQSGDDETLHKRLSLSEDQKSEAKIKKDSLLHHIKKELSETLELTVQHWLQGSYKNHTIIRPVRKGEEFDIDVGIYIFCNAEDDGLQAKDVKSLNRKVIENFCTINDEAKVNEAKNSCERVLYPGSFHIDIPIYFFDKDLELCKLATQNDGWVDSDPKKLQDWFDHQISSSSDA